MRTKSSSQPKPTSPVVEAIADELAELTRAQFEKIAAHRRIVPVENRPALSIEEAAELLGVTQGFLRRFVDSGDIPYVPMGTRIRLIRRESLDTWLRENERRAYASDPQPSGAREDTAEAE